MKRHVDCEALKGLATKVLYKSKEEECWVFDSLKTMARVISSNFAYKEEDKGDCFGIYMEPLKGQYLMWWNFKAVLTM